MSNLNSENGKSRSSRTGLIVAVCSVAAVLVLAVAGILLKDRLYCSLALKRVSENEFTSAYSILEHLTDDRYDALEKYIELRMDINRNYSALMVSFDMEKITEWRNTASDIVAGSGNIRGFPSDDAAGIYKSLETICTMTDRYEAIRPEILSAMDVFNEINSFYLSDPDGNRNVFTVAEERSKIAEWNRQCEVLAEYSSQLPQGDTVYLLSYLISEIRSECADLEAVMEKVLASGYSETDTVRVTGEGQKVFPDIKNSSGNTVNVCRKEEYEEYLYAGICRNLVQSLAEYYTGI